VFAGFKNQKQEAVEQTSYPRTVPVRAISIVLSNSKNQKQEFIEQTYDPHHYLHKKFLVYS
jgi:hypothetical protein